MSKKLQHIVKIGLAALVLLTGVITFAGIGPETPQALYAKAVEQTVLVQAPDCQGSALMFKRKNVDGKTRWFAWTAEHVVSSHKFVSLRVFKRFEGRIVGETKYMARVLQSVPGLDIALLFVDAPDAAFVASEFARADLAPLGTPVYVVGNFMGDFFPGSVSTGIISQHGPPPEPWWILDQSTAPIYPGASGGPIFNYDGLVLGIVVARVDATLGLFVPVRAIEEWANLSGYGWAVRGSGCPADSVGGFRDRVAP
jgi:serine protease Do